MQSETQYYELYSIASENSQAGQLGDYYYLSYPGNFHAKDQP